MTDTELMNADGDLANAIAYGYLGFEAEEIEEILASIPMEPDGPSGGWLLAVHDGYIGAVAGCAYSGFDCGGSGCFERFDSIEAAIDWVATARCHAATPITEDQASLMAQVSAGLALARMENLS